METTTSNKAHTKKLSVQVSLNGLSFYIHNHTSTPVYTENISFAVTQTPEEVLTALKKHLSKQAEQFSNIAEVYITHRNLLFTLIPQSLFDEKKLSTYLRYNVKTFETDAFDYDIIENKKMVIAYVPFTNINNYFFDLYGEFTFKHSTTVFLEKNLNLRHEPQTMYVQLDGNQMDVLVVKNNRMELMNSFLYTCPEDFIYYLLFIAEQLQLDPEIFTLKLEGLINQEDDYFKIAYCYIRHVSIETDSPLSLV